MAIDAAEILMQLGVKGKEIQELTLDVTSRNGGPQNYEWFNKWVQAYSSFTARDFSGSTSAFRDLDEKSILRSEVSVLVSLGQSHYYEGDIQVCYCLAA